MRDYSIVEMQPTRKQHKETIVTVASIGLENRMDIKRSFFVQNLQFLPAISAQSQKPESVLDKIAGAVGGSSNKLVEDVPLVQDSVSEGARQVRLCQSRQCSILALQLLSCLFIVHDIILACSRTDTHRF